MSPSAAVVRPRRLRAAAASLALFALVSPRDEAAAAPLAPFRLADIEADEPYSNYEVPEPLAAVNGRIVLAVRTLATGSELWSYDPVADETSLLLDLTPGPDESYPALYATTSSRVLAMVSQSGEFEFGNALIATDGTAQGTEVVAPTDTLSGPVSALDASCRTVGGRALFVVDNAGVLELWSIGAGSSELELLSTSLGETGDDGLFCIPRENEVWFVRFDQDLDPELWKTAGTTATTTSLVELPAWPRGNVGAVIDDQIVYLSDSDLYASDGTIPGTGLVKDLPGVLTGSGIVSNGERALFFANDASDRTQLWSTDGTTVGTIQLTAFALSDSFGSYFGYELVERRGAPFGFTASRFVFGAQATDPEYALWSVPPAGGAVEQLAFACVAPSCSGAYFEGFSRAGDHLVFLGLSDAGGLQPHATDGTNLGTERLGSFASGAGESMEGFFSIGGQVLFSAWIGSGQELWRTNGTEAGTLQMTDLPDDTYLPSWNNGGDLGPVPAFGRTWFGARSDFDENQLWSTDGDPASTELATAFGLALSRGSYPGAWAATNERVAFAASFNDDPHWFSTDSAGTEPLLLEAPTSASYETGPLALAHRALLLDYYNDEVIVSSNLKGDSEFALPVDASVREIRALYHSGTEGAFLADDFSSFSLWMTAGWPGTTRKVADLPEDVQASYPRSNGTSVAGRLLFSLQDGIGFDLWRSDGTAPGTFSLELANRDALYSSVFVEFETIGNVAFVLAKPGPNDVGRVWRTDGTIPGSTEFLALSNSVPGPIAMRSFGGKLYFLAAKPFGSGGGYALYQSASATPAPVLVAELPFENWPSGDLVATRSKLCFTANRLPAGARVFCSDGASPALAMIDIDPPGRSAFPHELVAVGPEVYFVANDDAHGIELWSTDGTNGGTVRRTDIASGPQPSAISNLFFDGCSLFFSADDGASGSEPWVLPFDPCPVRVFLDGFEDGLGNWSNF